MTPAERIVAKLANLDPFEFDELDRTIVCFFCSAEDQSPKGNVENPPDPWAEHEKSCLWRKAKEYSAAITRMGEQE